MSSAVQTSEPQANNMPLLSDHNPSGVVGNLTRGNLGTGRRKHNLTERTKSLAAAGLARQIGCLKLEDLPDSDFFDSLPVQAYNPKRVIRSKHVLSLVKSGSVVLTHSSYDTEIKTLEPGALFGDFPLLGQIMHAASAAAGPEGAEVAVMDEEAARRWVAANPVEVLEIVGALAARAEASFYRARFQLKDSQLATLLLELAGPGSEVKGYSHESLGAMIASYRETVTTVLDAWKVDGLVEVGRMSIKILDKRALRELRDL